MADRVNNIVLVHGGFVGGSGWMGVYGILESDGFKRERRPESNDIARG